MNNKRLGRSTIRLPNFDYSEPGEYFITICTEGKECWFGKVVNDKMILNNSGKIAEKCWQQIPYNYPNIELDEYVIMPNHVHGIIAIVKDQIVGAIHELPLRNSIYCRRNMLLSKVIGRYKMNSVKAINRAINNVGKKFGKTIFMSILFVMKKIMNVFINTL